MSWSRESVSVLIDEIKKHPCLYAVKTKAYSNKHLRQEALEEILSVIRNVKPNCTIQDIKNKFHGLKATFMAEHRKYISSQHSGMDEDDVYHPNLWYYNKLIFLLDHTEPRQGFDSFSIHNPEEPQEISNVMSTDELDFINSMIDEEGVLHASSTHNVGDTTSCDDNDSRPSSSPSVYKDVIRNKRKKTAADGTNVLKEASVALKVLSTSIEKNSAAIGENNTDNDKALTNFIISKLKQITDVHIRLDVEEKIVRLLYDGIKECKQYIVFY